MGRVSQDLTGKQFGRLTVCSVSDKRAYAKQVKCWLCICECGQQTIATTGTLTGGGTKSCGCLFRDRLTQRNTTHGMSKTDEYHAYHAMLKRCRVEHNYYSRGITVCVRWQESFSNFYQDMGDKPSSRHSIERIDNDGPYSPENCCWATSKVQNRNKRSNHFLTYEADTLTVPEWAERLGVKTGTIRSRIRNGWSDKEIIETPFLGRVGFVNQAKRPS